MSYYWKMSANIGSQTNKDYKYEGRDNKCRHQDKKVIASRVDRDTIRKINGTQGMKNVLQEGPLSIAVAAGNSCWRYYKDGILSKDNNCPGGIDHGVAIVGLSE